VYLSHKVPLNNKWMRKLRGNQLTQVHHKMDINTGAVIRDKCFEIPSLPSDLFQFLLLTIQGQNSILQSCECCQAMTTNRPSLTILSSSSSSFYLQGLYGNSAISISETLTVTHFTYNMLLVPHRTQHTVTSFQSQSISYKELDKNQQ